MSIIIISIIIISIIITTIIIIINDRRVSSVGGWIPMLLLGRRGCMP
jgi:hypothetical protein